MGTEFKGPGISLQTGTGQFPWYGIRTRRNYERVAAIALSSKGYDPYLPVYRRCHRRADAVVESENPVFPEYLFCRLDTRKRLPILMASGVISVMGLGKEPTAIPDEEIEAVKAILRSGLHAEPCDYLLDGRRVRVISGSLEGVKGIQVKEKNQSCVVVSVTMLQRSISVEIAGDQLAAM